MNVVPRRPRRGWAANVLAGGASLCAMQVGMLRALYERGIVPDLLVGGSACALNAAFVASRPSQTTTNQRARAWCAMRPRGDRPAGRPRRGNDDRRRQG